MRSTQFLVLRTVLFARYYSTVAGPFNGCLLTRMEVRTVMCLGLCLTTSGYILTGYATTIPVFISAFTILGKFALQT